MKNFGTQKQHLFYIIAKNHEDDNYDTFKDSHSFILSKNKEVRICFVVENNNYWQAPIQTDIVYLLDKAQQKNLLKYVPDEYDDCFLTSVCVYHMGLPDDCYELTQLR